MVSRDMPNIPEEVACVTTLGSLLGIAMANVQDAPSVFGPTERGIDVVFDLEGRRIGAQHTVFHFDEGTPGQRGSQARATEERAARQTTGATAMWIDPNWQRALVYRINEKIDIADRHDNRDVVAATWLVVSALLPRHGAAASTAILEALITTTELDRLFNAALTASRFDRVYLMLHLGQVVFGWHRGGVWQRVADPDARGREEGRRQALGTLDLIRRHGRGEL